LIKEIDMKRSFRLAAAVTLVLVTSTVLAQAAGPLTSVASLPLSPAGTRAHDLVVDGDLAYVATNTGLSIVDITNPKDPKPVATLALGGKVSGIALKESHVYLANQTKDFQVVSVSTAGTPVLVATRSLPSQAWDVAVKDNVAYVASFGGQLYLFDITDPANPHQIDVLGLPAWSSAKQDAANLAKLNSYTAAGSAKVTGVSVAGDSLFAVEWNHGRFYYYDVALAHNPVFVGTHYAPFTFRVEGDAEQKAVYILSAFGNSSGIHSATLSAFELSPSTRFNTCADCDYFQSPATDYGGLAVSSNGKYVVYMAGKRGVVQVLDVTDPADIKNAGVLSIPAHGAKTGESLGVALKGDHIFAAAGTLGLKVFSFPGLSN
jgi:LVIVD repeat